MTVFRIGMLATNLKTQVRFPVQDPKPKLRVMYEEAKAGGEKKCRFEVVIDFKKVPRGDTVDLIYEHYSPADFFVQAQDGASINFKLEANTAEITRWFSMPRGREYRDFRIYQYDPAFPDKGEYIKPVTEYLPEDATILAYKLLQRRGGTGHLVQWSYK